VWSSVAGDDQSERAARARPETVEPYRPVPGKTGLFAKQYLVIARKL